MQGLGAAPAAEGGAETMMRVVLEGEIQACGGSRGSQETRHGRAACKDTQKPHTSANKHDSCTAAHTRTRQKNKNKQTAN